MRRGALRVRLSPVDNHSGSFQPVRPMSHQISLSLHMLLSRLHTNSVYVPYPPSHVFGGPPHSKLIYSLQAGCCNTHCAVSYGSMRSPSVRELSCNEWVQRMTVFNPIKPQVHALFGRRFAQASHLTWRRSYQT